MEWDGKIASPSFVCAVSGQPLAPGEMVYSALVLDQAMFKRVDYAESAWDESRAGHALSWWRQRVPKPDPQRKRVRLDPPLLRKLFMDLRGSRERPQQCLCYVIVLCLVRARVFQLASVEAQDGVPWMVVDDKPEGLRLKVRDPRMDPAELAQVQAALETIVGIS
jgi:hypothetical protein